MAPCCLSVTSQEKSEWKHVETRERPSFSLSHQGPTAGETCTERIATEGDFKARNSSGFSRTAVTKWWFMDHWWSKRLATAALEYWHQSIGSCFQETEPVSPRPPPSSAASPSVYRLNISHELVGEAYVGTFTLKASLAMSRVYSIGQSTICLLSSMLRMPGMALW